MSTQSAAAPAMAATAEVTAPGQQVSAVRNVLALAKKELDIYFASPIAYAMFAVIVLIGSFFFLRLVGQYEQASMFYLRFNSPEMMERFNFTDLIMAPLLANMGVIFIFIVPFLTMRLVAEEKAQNTFELLMTTPLTSLQITLGKYLASLCMLAIVIGLLFIYPLLLQYGAAGESGVEWNTVLIGYLGLFLLGAVYMALGLFISSLTDSQVVAALLTFLVLLGLWIVGWAAGETEGWTRDALTYVSAVSHLSNFVRGILNLKDVAYDLSIVVFSLFLAWRFIERPRWV